MKRVAIIFGGRSGEHEISLISSQSIVREMDKEKYEPILIGISKGGDWYYISSVDEFIKYREIMKYNIEDNGTLLIPTIYKGSIFQIENRSDIANRIDVAFPVLHGTYGEDGTIQGLFEMMDIPYIGASTLGSSVCMDKDITKRLLAQTGIPVTPFIVIDHNKKEEYTFKMVTERLGDTIFVKPANLGSSVGINRVSNKVQFKNAINEALQYDNKIILERAIIGQEVECSVLGLDDLFVSIPGEIIPTHDFYSYQAKYLDADGAKLLIPARVSREMEERIKELAKSAFQSLACEIMARVDFLIEKSSGDIFVNELNTIPGFTSISMYPKLLEASGIPYKELISRLIDLAIQRHMRKKMLKTTFNELG